MAVQAIEKGSSEFLSENRRFLASYSGAAARNHQLHPRRLLDEAEAEAEYMLALTRLTAAA